MTLENQNILIVSNEPWGDTWFSKHNYANQLSKKNTVFFINPAKGFKISNWFAKNIITSKISDRLTILEYKNYLPVRYEWLRKINEYFVFTSFKKFFDNNRITDPIFWTFDPFRLSSPEKLHPKKIVLHAVDKYRFLRPSENILIKKADIVIAVAEEIAVVFKQRHHNVHVIPHAIPDEEFLDLKRDKNHPLIGVFVGNIDLRIDFDYTSEIIRSFPEIKFQFIGKIANDGSNSNLVFKSNLPNVKHFGEKPFNELKHFIRNADFCFLFKDNNFPGNNISSHKMLQYFAQGKPIFSSELTIFENVKHLLYMDNNPDTIKKLIKNFIANGENDKLANERVAFAKTHSFSTILNKIEKLL